MLRRKPPAELGRLVDVHRPLSLFIGWTIIGLFPVAFGILLTISPGWWAGLIILLGLGLPLAYGLGEILLLEHRIYEHGVMFRAKLIGTPIYVVPHYTIDPDSPRTSSRHKSSGFEASDRRFRQCPFIKDTVEFAGLHPRHARALGKGKLAWQNAGAGIPTDEDPDLAAALLVDLWDASVRDAERQRRLLVETIRASQRLYPYQRR